MALLEIRKKFITLSGRLDLVVDTTDYADNGADWFIQAGQRWLERQVEFPDRMGRVFRKLEEGKYGLVFRDARSIESVYAGDSIERGLLQRKTWDEILDLFPEGFPSTTEGTPKY